MPTSAPSRRKTEKLDLRVSPAAKKRLRQAASLANTTVTKFVLDSALTSADHLLADRREFFLSARKWEEFQAMLNAPPRDIPRLRKLLTETSALETLKKSGR